MADTFQATKPRGPIAAMYNSPGPAYSLPYLTGQKFHDPRSNFQKQPAYIFGNRNSNYSDDCSPGPCYLQKSDITRNGKDGTPQYSLYGRQKDIMQFNFPGPGAYSPEKAGQSAKETAPQYSFGIRHKGKQTDNTPAPNAYNPSAAERNKSSKNKQAPEYSLTGRPKTGGFSQDLTKTPGPGNYCTSNPSTTKNKSPQYSMTSRNVMPGDGTQKPGPGAHSPETVTVNKRRMPVISFGIRHSQYIAPMIIECDY